MRHIEKGSDERTRHHIKVRAVKKEVQDATKGFTYLDVEKMKNDIKSITSETKEQNKEQTKDEEKGKEKKEGLFSKIKNFYNSMKKVGEAKEKQQEIKEEFEKFATTGRKLGLEDAANKAEAIIKEAEISVENAKENKQEAWKEVKGDLKQKGEKTKEVAVKGAKVAGFVVALPFIAATVAAIKVGKESKKVYDNAGLKFLEMRINSKQEAIDDLAGVKQDFKNDISKLMAKNEEILKSMSEISKEIKESRNQNIDFEKVSTLTLISKVIREKGNNRALNKELRTLEQYLIDNVKEIKEYENQISSIDSQIQQYEKEKNIAEEKLKTKINKESTKNDEVGSSDELLA